MSRKHEKYERLIDFCKTLPPVPTAVAYPCDQSSLQGALDAARMGLIAPILVGPEARIRAEAKAHDIDLAGVQIVDIAGTRSRCGGRGCARARRQGGSADERQPPHRRAHGRRGQTRNRPAHPAAHQPLLRYGRARPCGDAHRDGRRGQHRADDRRQGPHHPERDRPCARAPGARGEGGSCRDPVRNGNREPQARVHHGRSRALQDGRSRADHRRTARRAARARQRDQPRGGADQENRLRPWPGAPTFSSRRISKPATCSRRA